MPVGGVGGHVKDPPTTGGNCGGITVEVTGGLDQVLARDAEETAIVAS